MSLFLKKLLRKLRIRDHGKNNTVKLPQKFKCNNALISIKGNNNIVEIEENFACREKLSLRIEGDNNRVHIGKNFYCHTNCDLTFYANNSLLNFRDDIHVYISIEVESFGGKDNLTIDVGNRTTFMNTHITCFEDNSSVIIGEDCIFSYDTVLYNTDGHPIYAIDGDEPLNRASHIKLGNHLWIAHSAVVLKNVELADNIIIGRNALVTKSFMQKKLRSGRPPRQNSQGKRPLGTSIPQTGTKIKIQRTGPRTCPGSASKRHALSRCLINLPIPLILPYPKGRINIIPIHSACHLFPLRFQASFKLSP